RKAPLKVTFTDKSTGTPTKWKWNFGDGKTSAKQNPVHKYYKAGKYTVTLTVSNAAGINKVTKSKYITVKNK
uniref:PKD domain-containing protein n=1 Tax=Methanosarcina barkeri TaxID=2208 RepID=UPI000A628C95